MIKAECVKQWITFRAQLSVLAKKRGGGEYMNTSDHIRLPTRYNNVEDKSAWLIHVPRWKQEYADQAVTKLNWLLLWHLKTYMTPAITHAIRPIFNRSLIVQLQFPSTASVGPLLHWSYCPTKTEAVVNPHHTSRTDPTDSTGCTAFYANCIIRAVFRLSSRAAFRSFLYVGNYTKKKNI